MKNAVAKVKNALSTRDILVELTHYFVKDGYIQASNGRLTAATPFPSKLSFLVPGTEFEKILTRMPKDPSLKVEDEVLRVHCGKYRGTVRILHQAEHTLLKPEGRPKKIDGEALLGALRLLRPFISENAIHSWSLAVVLRAGKAYATNNISLIEYEDFPLQVKGEFLLPIWIIDFLLSNNEPPTHYLITDNYVAFMYKDKSWVLALLINNKAPDQLESIMALYKNPRWKLTDEWCEAVDVLQALGGSVITFHPEKMSVNTDKADFEADIKTPCPKEGGFSKWNIKELSAILNASTHWNPASYPEISSFKGPNIRGVIAAMT